MITYDYVTRCDEDCEAECVEGYGYTPCRCSERAMLRRWKAFCGRCGRRFVLMDLKTTAPGRVAVHYVRCHDPWRLFGTPIVTIFPDLALIRATTSR